MSVSVPVSRREGVCCAFPCQNPTKPRNLLLVCDFFKASMLGENFPLAPVGCEVASTKLFSCLDKIVESNDTTRAADSSAPPALDISSCKTLMTKYNNCVTDALTKPVNAKLARAVERVPEEYRYSR